MIAYADGMATLHVGDVRACLADRDAESVHCVVTSPPYWGLRAYKTEPQLWGGDPACAHRFEAAVVDRKRATPGVAGSGLNESGARRQARQRFEARSAFCACGCWRGELGQEPTPSLYLRNVVEVFEAVRRVLRHDGTLWLNMGDAYEAGTRADRRPSRTLERAAGYWKGPTVSGRVAARFGEAAPVQPARNLKRKDLLGMPWRVAFALQEAGWWLRKDIVWSKPNPMPESTKDRPSSSHEYVFLLTKAVRYFYDGPAVAEPAVKRAQAGEGSGWDLEAHGANGSGRLGGGVTRYAEGKQRDLGAELLEADHGGDRAGGFNARWYEPGAEHPPTRNRRSVWTIPTQPYPEAHFATFPEELARIPILAGTSAKGCCPECGAPWRRVVVKTGHANGREPSHDPRSPTKTDSTGWAPVEAATDRWAAGCKHGLEPAPCTVLDPFAGSGTTLAVAKSLDRFSVGVELSPDYARLAERRIRRAAAQMALAP